ncbi:cell division protein FtsQ/DivIB [Alicyclobacillus fastidiosus]|uniref:FtsQ-type POTRA domain-containing protein n=1 Tax=Alicyclobacillus fastidiosus TaxID=392011 RepID=A0ABV5AIU4_9BACL|nr:FtsQ-type POTRA domain-containing protein [Alicyclobacillus fastidiosus]WEH08116.1 FtsQ-type POTRA domain-containing protein [Alicyclobacillus fastidiosus]
MPQAALTPADRQRRKSRNRKVIIGFFAFIGVVVLLESPLTRIRSMTVSGNTTIPAERVILDSGLHKGQSLWQVNGGHVASHITSMEPMIQSVSLSTDWLQGTVHFTVRERQIVAVYETSGKFYQLLNNGVVYQEASPKDGLATPIVTSTAAHVTIGQAVSPAVSAICKQLTKISAGQLTDVSEFHVNGDGTVSLYLDNQFVVTCDTQGLAGSLNAMHSAVQYFVSKGYQPGNIDLSGSPPYLYTPFDNQGAGSKQKGAQ